MRELLQSVPLHALTPPSSECCEQASTATKMDDNTASVAGSTGQFSERSHAQNISPDNFRSRALLSRFAVLLQRDATYPAASAMSEMSFWMLPSLKGDSSSTGERYFTTRAETDSKDRVNSCIQQAQGQPLVRKDVASNHAPRGDPARAKHIACPLASIHGSNVAAPRPAVRM